LALLQDDRLLEATVGVSRYRWRCRDGRVRATHRSRARAARDDRHRHHGQSSPAIP